MLSPWLCNVVVLFHVGRLRLQDEGCAQLCVLEESRTKPRPQALGLHTACTPPPFSLELVLASPSPRPGRSSSSTASCLVHLEALALRFLRLLSDLVVMAGDGQEVLSPCSRTLISGRGKGACLVNREKHNRIN